MASIVCYKYGRVVMRMDSGHRVIPQASHSHSPALTQITLNALELILQQVHAGIDAIHVLSMHMTSRTSATAL